ncbi:NlpC/P60 family protein [Streptomyces sp. NBC_01808]|uniref:C40 family peptidase n=1 Tax=Streptomyces sp. NBC_01808 TaxID=2975947 RepID=UPI002DD9F085|nr:NlpC/P60 family protein [Streptomyces sp. NBC_01808]WSA40073.1 NlpC/P60 family protein [Streptomyces sp. NBC_01808]
MAIRSWIRGRPAVVAASSLIAAVLLTQAAVADEPGGPDAVEEQRERAEDAAQRAADVRDRVGELNRQAAVAGGRVNEAEAAVDEQQRATDRLLARAAQATARVNDARRTLTGYVTTQYRTGATGLSEAAVLLLAEDPQRYADTRHLLSRLSARQQHALDRFTARQQEARKRSKAAGAAMDKLKDREASLREQEKKLRAKLAEARQLKAELSDREREEFDKLERAERAEAERRAREHARREAAEERRLREQQEETRQERAEGTITGEATAPAGDGPVSEGAEAAIAFAEAQVGEPYVWGATGPDTWDCSGLTQAAWRAAGVEIPRVTWDQVTAGTSVPVAELRPGDLVFFFDDISHVGLYTGGGHMIHAPRPGAVVRSESIYSMPIHSAIRPG